MKADNRIALFLDTNVVIDYLTSRECFSMYSAALFQLAEDGIVELYLSDITITNISYILRREEKDKLYASLTMLAESVNIVAASSPIIKRAIKAKWDDFEDATQYFSAMNCKADYLVTRNAKDFKDSTIPVVSPQELLQNLGYMI
ncbi:MAG: PIN domain-containing protein [Bacteroidaceae bacterium]|nr:PIN domain-containing protein [Bacteroidaceae bacterium]